jgi:hypothetical protein
MIGVLMLWILVAMVHHLLRTFEAGVTILQGHHLGRTYHSKLILTEGLRLLISETRSIGGVTGMELPMMTRLARLYGDPMIESPRENGMTATHHLSEVPDGKDVSRNGEHRFPVPQSALLTLPVH